jgi:hypothetical protein
MTKKLTWSLLLAALICAGAQVVKAQDQTPAPAPAAGTEQPAAKPAKHHGKMDACKDDISQYCADAKGRKAVHECLEKNADKLSQGCKDQRAKMEKMHQKHAKKAEGQMPAPAAQPAPATPPAQQ